MGIDFERDLRIDETALDVECLEQPGLMFTYGRTAAEARFELDNAKENVDVSEALVDGEVRENPGKFGLSKITESAIKSVIMAEQRCVEARSVYRAAKLESDLTTRATIAMDARKKMLELLVQLHGQSYFAGPKVPRDILKEAKRRYEDRHVTEKVQRRQQTKRKEVD